MRAEQKRHFPHPSIRRLPSYLRMLRRLQTDGAQKVSCTQIAKELDLDSTQVRKDLALTGITGRPRIGYELLPLIEAIEAFLGWNTVSDAFLVGAGSLGKALMGYENFRRCGLNIVAAFDVSEGKIGQEIFGRKVHSLNDMPAMAAGTGVTLGVLTVPGSSAQAAADAMVAAGIRGIWNFAPVRLDVPDSVLVENVELVSSLAVLSVSIAGRGK
jgi:redox-sensing transcriptional repressor